MVLIIDRVFLKTASALLIAFVVISEAADKKHSVVGAFSDGQWTLEHTGLECKVDGVGLDGGIARFKLEKADGRIRCEIALKSLIARNSYFSIQFDFKVDAQNLMDKSWHSYFQIHSFPDEGELWRCPILALEMKDGELRMFNRWDFNLISDTSNGTCAQKGGSISSRTMFEGVSIVPNKWHEFRVQGMLSLSHDACISIEIDKKEVGQACGANIFNDLREPYIKLGIYKPTSWFEVESIGVVYRDFKVQ